LRASSSRGGRERSRSITERTAHVNRIKEVRFAQGICGINVQARYKTLPIDKLVMGEGRREIDRLGRRRLCRVDGVPHRGTGCNPRRAWRCRSRAAALRRGHDLQRAAPQWSDARRRGCDLRDRGLGHLGVQFANKLGFRTVAIARGADKEALSRKLGADEFIDSATEDVAAALNRLGGARVVLATATRVEAMTSAIDGLAVRGRLIVVVTPSPFRSCFCN